MDAAIVEPVPESSKDRQAAILVLDRKSRFDAGTGSLETSNRILWFSRSLPGKLILS
jgi:hypothetical protein